MKSTLYACSCVSAPTQTLSRAKPLSFEVTHYCQLSFTIIFNNSRAGQSVKPSRPIGAGLEKPFYYDAKKDNTTKATMQNHCSFLSAIDCYRPRPNYSMYCQEYANLQRIKRYACSPRVKMSSFEQIESQVKCKQLLITSNQEGKREARCMSSTLK